MVCLFVLNVSPVLQLLFQTTISKIFCNDKKIKSVFHKASAWDSGHFFSLS